jgi:carbon starvation protein CstA
VPFVCVLIAPKGSWNDFWTLFGASNQLLAALTLAFDHRLALSSAQRIAFTLLPMLFVLDDYALGFDENGHRKFSRRKRFRRKFVNGVACSL